MAPPEPLALTVHGGVLELPGWTPGDRPPPTFAPGAAASSEDPSGTSWTVTDDVLRRTTTCSVRHGTDYDIPYEGHAWEAYAGDVSVDRRTFDQRASAECTYRLTWPGVDVAVTSTMRVDVTGSGYGVAIDVEAYDGGELVVRREWSEHVPRRGPRG